MTSRAPGYLPEDAALRRELRHFEMGPKSRDEIGPDSVFRHPLSAHSAGSVLSACESLNPYPRYLRNFQGILGLFPNLHYRVSTLDPGEDAVRLMIDVAPLAHIR